MSLTQAEFLAQYEPFVGFQLLPGIKKHTLAPAVDGQCRFCRRSEPDVSFKLTAHALPEFLGSGALIASDECDECNVFFANNLDDHLSKWLGPMRTLAQISGKKGVPSYRPDGAKSRIDIKEIVRIETHDGESLVTLDMNTKKLHVDLIYQPHIPLAAYKCLLKVAVSVIPAEELMHFCHLIAWLREHPHKIDTAISTPIQVLYTFVPGPAPVSGACLVLLRRKSDDADVPYMLFVLAVANYWFQVVVPSVRNKHLVGRTSRLYFLPTTFEYGHPYGTPTRSVLDMSADSIVRGRRGKMTLSIDSLIEIDPTQLPDR